MRATHSDAGSDDTAAMRREVETLVSRAGFLLSREEWGGMILNDFGLGDFRREGAAIIDLLRSPRLRITILVLLPGQTLPEHMHPTSPDNPGKEETIRVLWGTVKVYRSAAAGEEARDVTVPEGKTAFYTSRREIVLGPGDQHTLPPDEFHWFQAGSEGVVAIEFQNRIDETRNVFSDPASSGIGIGAGY